MANLYVGNLDDETHRLWKVEAKRPGISLNAILKECLENAARKFEVFKAKLKIKGHR